MTTPENAIRAELKRQDTTVANRQRRKFEPYQAQCLCKSLVMDIKCHQWGTPCLLYQTPPVERRGRKPANKDGDE